MSTGKVLLETIRVARHVSLLGFRPLGKVTKQALQAGEDVALWTLRSKPAEALLGRPRTQRIVEIYGQGRQIAAESVGSLTHESIAWACQHGANAATEALQTNGVQMRVVGPFDVHWNMRKVIRELQAVSDEQTSVGHLRLTPARFVQLMKEAARKKARARVKDPVEAYVDYVMNSGRVRGIGIVMFEKKLYSDVARMVCFAFDHALDKANGLELWGHQLKVKNQFKLSKDDAFDDHEISRRGYNSAVSVTNVEEMVDQLLTEDESALGLPNFFRSVQRQLLVNCCIIILSLVEDITSRGHMQINVLGHNLSVELEPLPLKQIWMQAKASRANTKPEQQLVNEKAIDELVDAILDEAEVQHVLVPDIVEAEVYRYALHKGILIVQEVLAGLRIQLFGIEVRLDITAENDTEAESAGPSADDPMLDLKVTEAHLQTSLERLSKEQRRIEQELAARQTEEQEEGLAGAAARPRPEAREAFGDAAKGAAVSPDGSEFEKLAAQDRLSRSLAIQRTVSVPIETCYQMVSDVPGYTQWMPFVTDAKVTATRPSKTHRARTVLSAEVGIGIDTNSFLGTVGDTIRYKVTLWPPPELVDAGGAETRSARVVADTIEGFSYGKRLIYDWSFVEQPNGDTNVRLDMFFQAKNILSLPLWDSMQATIVGHMLKKFLERTQVLIERSAREETKFGRQSSLNIAAREHK